ncbi:hypothetical protein BGW38_007918 [Lunasporangiospora selenospora]|uniref:Uncharacterized protein n=1 Tax=Lunasporangiospora selenospora TaxID=979761 RepID=A0A9P6FZE5_9FUNG|nr:hypothetical protein BGW38_007918 [Lunasporangiospora selenospora]
MRRAYDYWKSLTVDADERAKELVIEARTARDKAALEARWAYLGFKREAREAFEVAEKKYKEALANAERVHEEALESAKSKWFQAVDTTEKEVKEVKDEASEATHETWSRFKAAVDSLIFNPPKYGCSPSSQYWFSRQNPAADSGWDCREIWDHSHAHPSAYRDLHFFGEGDHGQRRESLKNLPKKIISPEKLHDMLTGLYSQAVAKAKHAPSASSFELGLKPTRDHYQVILDRIVRNDHTAQRELEMFSDKIKAKLNEAKYYEEQTDAWLTAQWNAVIDNAGSAKDHYQKVFKSTLRTIQDNRNKIYNSLIQSLQKTVDASRSSVHHAIHTARDNTDTSMAHNIVRDAVESFVKIIREMDTRIKGTPKHAFFEAFQREESQLKTKLQVAIAEASRSALSVSNQASKTKEMVMNRASKSMSSVAHKATEDAKHKAKNAKQAAESKYRSVTTNAQGGYEQASATMSSVWESATPQAASIPHRVHASYHRMLDGVKSNLFNEPERQSQDLNASSIYSAILAAYFLFLTYRIWATRRIRSMQDPTEMTYSVVNGKSSDPRPNGASMNRDYSSGEHPSGHYLRGWKQAGLAPEDTSVPTLSKFKTRRAVEDELELERSSIQTILTQFTSTVPVTLLLLTFLEWSGFNRIGLHSLFVGLITSLVMQGGFLNKAMISLAVVDGVHMSGNDVGYILSWGVLALAAMANGIKVLHS